MCMKPVEHANEVIRAYQDLHDARDRLSAEVREIEARTQPKIKAIMSENADGTLEELRTLVKEHTDAKERLDEMNKKVRGALSAAYSAHSKAVAALIDGAGLMAIKRNTRNDHCDSGPETPANQDEMKNADDSVY
jgi:predicted nuclease with TOPRIM domain